MKVLWDESPATTTTIIDKLKENTDWKPKTVHSLINRLVKKGALGVDRNSPQYHFFPLVSKEECVRDETRSFVRRVYDGSFYHMVANFYRRG